MLLSVLHRTPSPVVVTAGFPCQDISIINCKAIGISGSRSNLFFEILRIVDLLYELNHAVYLILENSPMVVTRGLAQIEYELVTKRLMTMKWVKCAAEEVGAYHRRQRWFAIAYKDRGTPDETLQSIGAIDMHASRWALENHPQVLTRRNPGEPVPCGILRAIGNAIVPQQAMYALHILLADKGKAQTKSKGGFPICTSSPPGTKIYTHRPVFRGPRIHVVMDDGRTRLVRDQWPTPIATDHRAKPLRRAFGPSLVNAAFYSQYGQAISGSTNHTQMNMEFHISIQFLAWLMGYPEAHFNHLLQPQPQFGA
jgi:site-specific DNA-cytosine methylase